MQDVDNLAEAKTAQALDTVGKLTHDQKIDFAQDFMEVLKTPKQKEDVASAVVKKLTPEQQKNLAEGLIGHPSPGMTDYLWAISISSFALVLLGVSAGIIVGVIWMEKSATDVQPVLTLFTAVVGSLEVSLLRVPLTLPIRPISPLKVSKKSSHQHSS